MQIKQIEHERACWTCREIVGQLDRYIIGQGDAKRAVAIALRNRWRRMQLPEEMRREVVPNNIILIGPTGRGQDRDRPPPGADRRPALPEGRGHQVHREGLRGPRRRLHGARPGGERHRPGAPARRGALRRGDRPGGGGAAARHPLPAPGRADDDPERAGSAGSAAARRSASSCARACSRTARSPSPREQCRGAHRQHLHLGGRGVRRLLRREPQEPVPQADEREEDAGGPGPRRCCASRRPRSGWTWTRSSSEAIELVEQGGIIFLDEIDKIAGKRRPAAAVRTSAARACSATCCPSSRARRSAPSTARCKTDHVLFIAAGAFHMSKPSDLIPELQGRFPIRVELDSLTEEDFVRILRDTESSLLKQYQALLARRRLPARVHRRRRRTSWPAWPPN